MKLNEYGMFNTITPEDGCVLINVVDGMLSKIVYVPKNLINIEWEDFEFTEYGKYLEYVDGKCEPISEEEFNVFIN